MNRSRFLVTCATLITTLANAASAFASELHDASIAGLKQTFSSFGMTLLTPPEFLDTPEKQAAYRDFTLATGGTDKFFSYLQNKDQYHGIGSSRAIKSVTR